MPQLMRSLLFVPGTRPDRFAKAERAGADAVVFDLEDSVEAAKKAEARAAIADYLASTESGPARIVRINGCRTHFYDDDLALLEALPPFDAVMIPKVEHARTIEQVAHVVPGRLMIPLIETAHAVLNAVEIIGAVASIPAIVFGGEDLTAQIGATRTVEGEELLFARSKVLLAATAIGADAIDGVLTVLDDAELLRRDARRARDLGFRGKLAIHPNQVAVINDVFTPGDRQIADARRIVAAYDAAAAHGEGVLRLGDEMIDMPVVVRARRVLDVVERIERSRRA